MASHCSRRKNNGHLKGALPNGRASAIACCPLTRLHFPFRHLSRLEMARALQFPVQNGRQTVSQAEGEIVCSSGSRPLEAHRRRLRLAPRMELARLVWMIYLSERRNANAQPVRLGRPRRTTQQTRSGDPPRPLGRRRCQSLTFARATISQDHLCERERECKCVCVCVNLKPDKTCASTL